MNMARRGILKLIGMAPAAAGSAASSLAPLLESPAVVAAKTLANTTTSLSGEPSAYGILGPVIGKQVVLLRKAMENEVGFAPSGQVWP